MILFEKGLSPTILKIMLCICKTKKHLHINSKNLRYENMKKEDNTINVIINILSSVVMLSWPSMKFLNEMQLSCFEDLVHIDLVFFDFLDSAIVSHSYDLFNIHIVLTL